MNNNVHAKKSGFWRGTLHNVTSKWTALVLKSDYAYPRLTMRCGYASSFHQWNRMMFQRANHSNHTPE